MARPHYSRIYQISDDAFREFVNRADTYTQILRYCGEEYKNINTVKRRIALMKLDTSHIQKGWGHNAGKKFVNQQISLEEVLKNRLTENSRWSRASIKGWIIRYNLIPYKCECGIDGSWRNKPISLQLEHRNGIADDNRLNNLCFLCPNCHSQTATFSGKKARKLFKEYDTPEFKADCKTLKTKDILNKYNLSNSNLSKVCRRLSISRKYLDRVRQRKVVWPTKEELVVLVAENPMTKIGLKFGVSDNAVRRWCKKFNIAL